MESQEVLRKESIAENKGSPLQSISRSYSFIQGTTPDNKLPFNRAPSMRFDAGLVDLEKQVVPIIPENCPVGAKATVLTSTNPVYDYHQLKECKYGSNRDINNRVGSVILKMGCPCVLESDARQIVADNWHLAFQNKEIHANESFVTNKLTCTVDKEKQSILESNTSNKFKKTIGSTTKNAPKKLSTKAGTCKKFGKRSVYSSNLDILVAQITSSPYTVKPNAPYTVEYLKKANEILELKFSAERLNNSHHEDDIVVPRSVMLQQVKAVVPVYDPHYKQENKATYKGMNRADNEHDLGEALKYIEEMGTHLISHSSSHHSMIHKGSTAGNSRDSPAQLKKVGTSSTLDASNGDTIAPLPNIISKNAEFVGIAGADVKPTIPSTIDATAPIPVRKSSISPFITPALSRSVSHTRVPDDNSLVPTKSSRRESMRMIVDTITDLAADCVNNVAKINEEAELKRLQSTRLSKSADGSKDNGELTGRRSLLRLNSATSSREVGNSSNVVVGSSSSLDSNCNDAYFPSVLPNIGRDGNVTDDDHSNLNLGGTLDSSVVTKRKVVKSKLENQFNNILNYSTAFRRSKFTEFQPFERKSKTTKEIKEMRLEKLEAAMISRANSISLFKQPQSSTGKVNTMDSIQEALANVRDKFVENDKSPERVMKEVSFAKEDEQEPSTVLSKEPVEEPEYTDAEVRSCLVDILSSHTSAGSAKLLHNNNINVHCKRPSSANNAGIVPHSSPAKYFNPMLKASNKYQDMKESGIFVDHRRQGWGLDYSKHLHRDTVDFRSSINDWNSYKSVQL